MLRFKRGALTVAAMLVLLTPRAQGQFVDTHNGADTPECCAWSVGEAGWVYTPSTAFTLTMIETRFGIGEGYSYTERTVTAEIRSSPTGPVLGSASFASVDDVSTWIGGSFAGVSLLAGTTYFIDFLNLKCSSGMTGCLGFNAVGQSASGEYGDIYVGTGGPLVDLGADSFDPIIRLTGTLPNDSVVPEPATLSLFATGLVGMVGAGLRRRRRV